MVWPLVKSRGVFTSGPQYAHFAIVPGVHPGKRSLVYKAVSAKHHDMIRFFFFQHGPGLIMLAE